MSTKQVAELELTLNLSNPVQVSEFLKLMESSRRTALRYRLDFRVSAEDIKAAKENGGPVKTYTFNLQDDGQLVITDT